MNLHFPHRSLLLGVLLVLCLPLAAVTGAAPLDPATARGWIADMKGGERGPFARIRWFCADGVRLPPEPGACQPHGGGIQHGEWDERALALRAAGYHVANVLAALGPAVFTAPDSDLDPLKQLLLERFLILADDGWIFRRARYYRGALQAEEEQAGAQRLLLTLLDAPGWRAPERYLPLREAVRLLPTATHPTAPASAIRQQATSLAERDVGFLPLRIKLHVLPEAGDADRVRAYAQAAEAGLASEYRALADAIDELYRKRAAAPHLRQLAAGAGDSALRALLREGSAALAGGRETSARLAAAGRYAVALRRYVESSAPHAAGDRLIALQAGIALEDEAFVDAGRLDAMPGGADRRALLARVGDLAASLYGSGLISARQWRAVSATVEALDAPQGVEAGDYLDRVGYLAGVAGWAQRNLEFHFETAVATLGELEPLSRRFLPDRLRSGPLLFYSRLVERLEQDAAQLAGQHHTLFGHSLAGGLHALNPGLGRGVLRLREARPGADAARGIYLLPETLEELPPVAGIITRGEGNGLSHVQLLARNLGIPNVVVTDATVAQLAPHDGVAVVLAVSPRGTVQIERDAPLWGALFGGGESRDETARLEIDPARLELARRTPIPLNELRAEAAGRLCGPKAANLGELLHHYPRAVAPGVVIPFGAFRALMEQPLEPGGPPLFAWLRERYAAIARLDGEARQEAVSRLLARLRHWITDEATLNDAFLGQLRAALEREFGPDGSYGVFVRSDTNVEDLPGFTGAGLNRTEPNVVGFEAIVAAVRRVWASPFSERAYAWRQARMSQPEHVYPAVLIQRSVPVAKSGVMITADIDSGDRGGLSLAVSEGVGGAVAGQRAEELRVRLATGTTRLISQASQPLRSELDPRGGLRKVPASGAEELLSPTEIKRLMELARELPKRGLLRAGGGGGADGGVPVADVEFGFVAGRLMLFQIRPFVENRNARRIEFLARMDAGLEERRRRPVALGGTPAPREGETPRVSP